MTVPSAVGHAVGDGEGWGRRAKSNAVAQSACRLVSWASCGAVTEPAQAVARTPSPSEGSLTTAAAYSNGQQQDQQRSSNFCFF